jgi:hypothetical protein
VFQKPLPSVATPARIHGRLTVRTWTPYVSVSNGIDHRSPPALILSLFVEGERAPHMWCPGPRACQSGTLLHSQVVFQLAHIHAGDQVGVEDHRLPRTPRRPRHLVKLVNKIGRAG